MEVIRNLINIKSRHQGGVVTIGNFDGVHRGHQMMLQQIIAQARSLQVPSIVITFEPHPAEFFSISNSPIRLTSFREKLKALRELGVDVVMVLSFNQQLAQQSAEEFVKKVLIEKLAVKQIVVGDDFHFGHNRAGNFTLLEKLAKMAGFSVTQISTITDENERISSTRLRELLKKGEVAAAKKLLGRSFTLSGRVQSGAKRGRELGFPTANIKLYPFHPLSGVFMVKVQSEAFEGTKIGVANVGTRPTVDGLNRLLEVHLFDFNGNLYNYRLDVEFIKKIRDEKKFNSLDELKAQIQKDVETALAYGTEGS